MSDDRLLAQQRRFFSTKFLECGPTAQGVDWRDEAAQRLRFEQFVRLLDHTGRFSLNDYGCGYGAFAAFLRDRLLDVDYHGYDISQPMIEYARRTYAGPGVQFVERQEDLPVADYTVAIGVFNMKLDLDEERWTEHVLASLRSLRDLSRRGFAFNMLTSYSEPGKMRGDLYYADPCFFFDFCQREFSRRIALLHDYAWEFTILVRLDDGVRV